MSDDADARVARNEALFREANEAIERGLWPGEQHEAVQFRCECAQVDCGRIVQLGLSDYQRVRANPRRFVMLPGHQMPEFETVVEEQPDYVVVEKRGEAGQLAESLDPRDG